MLRLKKFIHAVGEGSTELSASFWKKLNMHTVIDISCEEEAQNGTVHNAQHTTALIPLSNLYQAIAKRLE
jgi:hypothetical protein